MHASSSNPSFVGIDLGGTSIHAAAVRNGVILARAGGKTPQGATADEVIRAIAALVEELRGAVADPDSLSGLCIGAPGAVDSDAGIVRHAPNLDWSDVPLGPELSALVGLPVVVENDVTIGAIGEHAHGAGRGSRHMAAVFVGTGVGGALVVDGTPHRGFRGAAGEFGHLVAVPEGGRLCGCGRRGCFEAHASRTAMEEIVRERIADGRRSAVPGIMAEREKTRLTSSVVEAALDAGDELLTEVVSEAQRHLATLVTNLVNAFDPEVVVFGGGLVERLGARFVDPIAAMAREGFLQQDGADRIRIVPGSLGDDAGTLGAARVAEGRFARAGGAEGTV